MADKLKFVLALVLVAAGWLGFYLLGEQPTILRVLSVLLGPGARRRRPGSPEPGRRFYAFARAATKARRWSGRRAKRPYSDHGHRLRIRAGDGCSSCWDHRQVPRMVLYDLILGWKKS